jgi:hypothetical protein
VVALGVGVADRVGVAEVLVVGLGDGGAFFEEDEHPATARLTPKVSTRAAGRVRARLCFTLLGYRSFVWRARVATPA